MMSESVRESAKRPEATKKDRTSQTQTSDHSLSASFSVNRLLFLQRTIGNQAFGRLIKSGALQAKLKIGQPGDKYEREADRVADAVMRMRVPHFQRACPMCEEGDLRRQPIQEEEEELRRQPIEEDEEELQTKTASGSIPEVQSDIESHIQSLKGGGRPLSENDRAFFEPRFSHDFSQVRIYTNNNAAKIAHSI